MFYNTLDNVDVKNANAQLEGRTPLQPPCIQSLRMRGDILETNRHTTTSTQWIVGRL